MSTVKLKILLIVLLISGLTLGGAGLLAHQILGVKIPEEPPQPGGERAATPPPENKPQPAVDRFGDPLPERALARLGTVRFRMGGLVCACAWSPDGKTLAAGSAKHGNDNTITLFDAATGKPIRRLSGLPSKGNRVASSPGGQFGNFISDSGPAGSVTSLAFSPDGRTLASGSDTGISLWDLATGKMLRQFKTMTSQSGIYARSLAFTTDGKGLISAGDGPAVHLWDPATGKIIRQFKGQDQLVRCAVLSPDGLTLALAADKEILLWEMATGKLLRRLTGQKAPIRALAFSPDGKLLASGSDDHSINSIWMWETATGKIHRPFPEEDKVSKSSVRSLAISPDGKMLAAGYGDYAFRLWDMATGKKLHESAEVRSITTHWEFHDGGIQCVVFSRDGKKLVLARDHQLILLDAASGKEIVPMPAHRGGMQRVFFSPDGKRLLTINDEPGQRILEWNADTGELIRQVPGRATLARLASFSPDRKIMVSAWNTDSLTLWDVTNGKEIRTIALPSKDSESPNSVIFSPNGRLLAVEDWKGEAVWLFDAATGKQLCTVEEMGTLGRYAGASGSLAFSADGRLLAAAGFTKIHLAEVPSGRQLLHIDLPEGRRASAIALSPDGRSLAAPCYNFAQVTLPSMTLWESASGKERLVLSGPPSQVKCVVFSPDGRLLAAGGYDQIVYVWDVIAEKLAARLEGHQGSVESLAFSPDGRRLASASRDTTALIWDVSGLAKDRPRRGSLDRKELDESPNRNSSFKIPASGGCKPPGERHRGVYTPRSPAILKLLVRERLCEASIYGFAAKR